jgi:transposase-like protein
MPGILQKQFQDEDAAREFLEKLFWPDGPVCPHCGVIGESTKLEMQEGTSTHGRKGLYQCNGCRKQFSVTIGTIFEDSHVPLHKWLMAIYLMCSSKKGISALQLQRTLELGSYRTAWFLAHRVRWAMTQGPMTELLKGVIEVDETWIGPNEKGKPGARAGRPMADGKKTPVLALVERGGNVRSFPLERATLKNIKPIMEQHIDPSSHLVTDEFPVYYQMRERYASHHEIKHKDKQYVRKEGDFTVTTNTVESYFALLKRANYGIHHHWSRKYLPCYCSERDFLYNTRRLSDDERTRKVVKLTEGRRLMLKEPKGATRPTE